RDDGDPCIGCLFGTSRVDADQCRGRAASPRSVRWHVPASNNPENPMSSLSLWSPFREMDDLISRFQRTYSPAVASVADWSPTVDIAETDKEYTVKADLAGVRKEDVKIEVHNGVLTVSGER